MIVRDGVMGIVSFALAMLIAGVVIRRREAREEEARQQREFYDRYVVGKGGG